MKTVTNLLIVCGLALAPAACKKDRNERTGEASKTVEEQEKEAIAQKDDVAKERDDVAEAKAELGEQRADLAEEKKEFAVQRDQFVATARTKMQKLDARIDAIKADYAAGAANLKADAKKDMNELLTKLERERAEAKTAFDAAANGTVERWNDLEKNTGEALDDLEETAKSTIERMKGAGVTLRAELKDAID